MNIDQTSFNYFLKTFCHLPRRVDSPQLPLNISYFFSLRITEINRKISRVILHRVLLQTQLITQYRNLISCGHELSEMFGDAQSLRVADNFLPEFH
jgi:hypothetical protein